MFSFVVLVSPCFAHDALQVAVARSMCVAVPGG